MTILIIDTSSELLHLALSSEEKILVWESSPHSNQLSKFLLPSIETLLQAKGISKEELRFIAIGTGPGSFNGMRVGAIVGMTLAFGLNIPAIGFSSSYLKKDPSLLLAQILDKIAKRDYTIALSY
jgi:tRNA threonylcarbamoyl adenosine modification protein YeaZ